MARITFIGLGHMGLPMAGNLIKAGHELYAHDLNPEAVATLQTQGAHAVADLAAQVAASEFVITMLPAAQHVDAVYLGDDGLFAHAAKSALLIDCSTIDVTTAKSLGQKAAHLDLTMLDAPVSGGVSAAQSGNLTFMVGGEETAYLSAKPILSAMGKAVIHAGRNGAGQAAKLCNNMLLAITMIGTCEAFGLARKLGLEDQVFFDIAAQSSGQNWSLTTYCPVAGPVPTSPANRHYAPGFKSALMLKDLGLAMQSAHDTEANTPLGSKAYDLYQALCQHGLDADDFSVMMSFLNSERPA